VQSAVRQRVVCAAIVLQEPVGLLQHLFYFIARETRAAIKLNKTFI